MLPILIVEDDPALREALEDTLRLSGYEAVPAKDAEEGLHQVSRRRFGLVLSDVMMPGMDGHQLLRRIKAERPEMPVLLMTAYGEIERAVQAMREGAADYLPKPFEPRKLLAAVARHMLPESFDESGEVVAQAATSREVLELARRVAATETTVLITGPTGTGKEVVARFIHRHSARANGPFAAINCAAIPEHLLEATLFGHEKGAFTGAQAAYAGKFEQAQGGTLLLDEVSEMSLALQAKLLRVLQEKEVERLGGRKPIALDVRVLATSNRDLQKAVKAGSFREDLYYRLSVFPLTLPALANRREDIGPLATYFLKRYAGRLGRPAVALSDAALRRLTQYGWPGNIRELENVIQRAIILAPGAEIEPEHLRLPEVEATVAESEGRDIKSLERAHILQTLDEVQGSRKKAAALLGMSERTLRYKLQQYREQERSSEGAG
jgi:two-component system, response regulator FlrC